MEGGARRHGRRGRRAGRLQLCRAALECARRRRRWLLLLLFLFLFLLLQLLLLLFIVFIFFLVFLYNRRRRRRLGRRAGPAILCLGDLGRALARERWGVLPRASRPPEARRTHHQGRRHGRGRGRGSGSSRGGQWRRRRRSESTAALASLCLRLSLLLKVRLPRRLCGG